MGWKLTFDSDHIRLLELGRHSFYLQNYYQKDWCENNMLHIGVESVDKWFDFVKEVFAENTFSAPEEKKVSGAKLVF